MGTWFTFVEKYFTGLMIQHQHREKFEDCLLYYFVYTRDEQSAPIWSLLQFDPQSFNGSDWLLEILIWIFSFNGLLEICEIEL